MSLAYLSLGSNLGDKEQNLRRAVEEISKLGQILKVSSFYLTKPYGYYQQPDFLNSALILETSLDPVTLLDKLKEIEERMGRVPTGRWRERVIDIDIIFYDSIILKSDYLTIPHPDLENREFVLKPLWEIAPDFVHPISGKRVEELLENLKNLPFVDSIETEVGNFYFAIKDGKVCQTSFFEIKGRREIDPFLAKLRNALERYFKGEAVNFHEFTLWEDDITPFFKKVYHFLRENVRWGELITYAELAKKVGKPNGARAVGNAMAKNPFPIIVPCHRVIRSDKKLGGFGGGEAWKRYLLKLEGVSF